MNERERQVAARRRSFLDQRFLQAAGETETTAHRGSYAIVRQAARFLGLVAVDGDGSVWYTRDAGDQAGLIAHGFTYSDQNLLASHYLHLPYKSFIRRPATPAAPRQEALIRAFPKAAALEARVRRADRRSLVA